MTTSSPFDDDLLSAALDDELDAEQRAAIDTDPAAARRLAELRRARDAVAEPVNVPVGAADRAIAAALAARTAASVTAEHDAVVVAGAADPVDAADRPHLVPPADVTTAAVVDLQAHRNRRQLVARSLSAAAAFVLLAIAGVAVWSSSNDAGPDQVATASDAPTPLPSSTTTAGNGTGGSGATQPSPVNQRSAAAGSGSESFTETSSTLPGSALSDAASTSDVTGPAPVTSAPASADLGDVVDATDLQAKVRAVVGVEPLAGVTTNVACAPVDPTELVVWSGSATYAGAPLSVQVRQHASDAAHIVGLNSDTCTIVFDIAR